YQLSVGGGTGSEASIGHILLRKVATNEVIETIGRLVEAWLEERRAYEAKTKGDDSATPFTFYKFCEGHSVPELKAITLGEEIEEVKAEHVTLQFTGQLVAYAGGIEKHRLRDTQARTVQRLLKSISRRFNRLKEEILLDNNDEFYANVNLF